MTLLEWTPLRGLRYGAPAHRPVRRQAAERGAWLPATDIFDTESDYVLKMEVPGFSKKEMQIEFKDSILSVKGEKEENVGDAEYVRNERRRGNFSRSFQFPRDVEGKKINAKLKDGILELRIAKPLEKKPRHIEVKAN
mgnify:CR=1 FL=1